MLSNGAIFDVAPTFIAGECTVSCNLASWNVGDKPQRYASVIPVLYAIITAIFAVASGFIPDESFGQVYHTCRRTNTMNLLLFTAQPQNHL